MEGLHRSLAASKGLLGCIQGVLNMAHMRTQTPGRIPKVDPPWSTSSALLQINMEVERGPYKTTILCISASMSIWGTVH